jgi:general secretion pathway protein D
MSVPRTIALLLFGFTSALFAQNPMLPPPSVPVPDGPEAKPAKPPAPIPVFPNQAEPDRRAPQVPLVSGDSPDPSVPPIPKVEQVTPSLGDTKITVPIEEPKLSGTALAGLYGKYTGRRVIVSSAAANAEFAFVQNASVQDPLTYAHAAELLRKAATIENFVFVPDGEDPNLDFLTLSTGGIRPTGRGVEVYNENRPLPEGDAVISYVMTLEYIKPAEAVNTFTQIIGQFGAYGSIAPVPNASAVVITENTSLIRKLIELKKEIDVPSSKIATKFFEVKNADVTEIAQTLTTLFTSQQSAQTTAGIQRTGKEGVRPAQPGMPVGGRGIVTGESNSGEAAPLQIIPDPRTNRIFAMGRPVDLATIGGLIKEFDLKNRSDLFFTRKLHYLQVSDFLTVASDALTLASSGTSVAGGGAVGGAGTAKNSPSRGSSNTNSTSRTSGGNNGPGTNFGGATSGGGSASGGTSAGTTGDSLNDPNVNAAPQSVLVGRTMLVADNITNSIIVQGPPSGTEVIKELLDRLDVKPDQIMISTVIGQLTLNDTLNTGVDYLYNGSKITARGGSGDGAILPILQGLLPLSSGATPVTPFNPGTLAGSGLQAYGKINNLGIYLKALKSKTDFTVLSRPSIITTNNKKGEISSGERIAIPTGSNSYGNTGTSSTQIEYQNVVLKLEVIPLVNSENEITMQIALLNDEENGTQTIAGGGGNGGDLTVPRIATRQILTTATVPNNETIVLGGLIVKRDDKTKSGIPILGDIPYLGKLFSSDQNTKDRTELMIFIQPSIIKAANQLGGMQSEIDSRYAVSEKARRFADGPAALPPENSITPTSDKGGDSRISVSAPVPRATVPENDIMKPSLVPIHHR